MFFVYENLVKSEVIARQQNGKSPTKIKMTKKRIQREELAKIKGPTKPGTDNGQYVSELPSIDIPYPKVVLSRFQYSITSIRYSLNKC